jgi:hypothetical protein
MLYYRLCALIVMSRANPKFQVFLEWSQCTVLLKSLGHFQSVVQRFVFSTNVCIFRVAVTSAVQIDGRGRQKILCLGFDRPV